MNPASWIEVNLTQLRENLAGFRAMLEAGRLRRGEAHAPDVCGVVKADAFGVGLEPIARCLADAGIDMLAVYSPQQAEPLAQMGLRCPVMLLMPTFGFTLSPALQAMAMRGLLHVTIHHETQLHEVAAQAATLGCTIPVHLMIDTGMSRAGLSKAQFLSLVDRARTIKNIRLAGVYTHMASPDSDPAFTHEQAGRFDQAIASCLHQLPQDVTLHVANTFATLTDHAHHREMIRVGLGLYGYGPESLAPDALLEHAARIKPIVRWMSRLVHVQRYPRGAPVGYNSTHHLTRDSVLGLVPAGYADGYPRSLSNKGIVEVVGAGAGGKPLRAPVLGRVNMDQIVVDVTDAQSPDSLLGTPVEIYSDRLDSACALHEVAALANTNCYELLCRLSPRTARVYT